MRRFRRALVRFLQLAPVIAVGCSSDGNGASSSSSSSGGGAGGNAADGGNAANGGGTCAAAASPTVDVVDGSGAILPDVYRRIAASYGGEEGMRYRLGEDASCYHPTPETRAALHPPVDRFCLRPGNYGSGFLYQVGADACAQNVGDFSSTQGIALYTADAPDDGGVNVLQVLSEGFDVFQTKPQVSWTFGSPIPWQLGSPAWIAENRGPVNAPIAAGRSYRDSNGEQNVEALVAFQSGLIGAFGENTGNNGYRTRLPPGLVPTSLAMTNGNELALVTVWDPSDLTGKIAVFATTSCEESTEPMCLPTSSLLSSYAIQHHPYPGFAHNASYTGAKLLGLVPLPEMHAPTAISATSNYQVGWWTRGGANTVPSQFDLGNEADRQTFVSGENKLKYSSAGFAVVLSLSEKKVAFVDLKPIFAFYKKMYFGDRASFDATRALGPGAHQWPYTFADTPEQVPTVTTTVSLPDRPTSVVTARYKAKASDDGYGALVATRDGTLTSYAVGGLVDGSGATPADIRAIGTVAVGRNPTQITYRKVHTGGKDPFSGSTTSVTRDEVIVASRGDREIDFVRIDPKGTSGAVYQRIQDSTLIDPVAVEDNDTHGTESYVLTVADYGGRQILNYRFGPIILHTNGGASFGMGLDGKAPFELGGTYAVAGKPFLFSSANVP